MRPHDRDQELQQLCEAVVEGRLTEAQRDRLEELVLQDRDARRYYVEYLHQHAALHWSGADPELVPFVPRAAEAGRSSTGRGPVLRRVFWVAGTMAAAVLVAVAAWSLLPAGESPTPLATLASARACKWESGSLPTETGARLRPGRLRLAEGIARIVFDNGAELTLEAPADLELLAADRCRLHAGRLIAHVPPAAHGFVIDTATAVFTDLGTEFGVHVRDGRADLQVFNGMVDVEHRPSRQTERLETGRNRRYTADQIVDFDPQAEKPASLSLPPRPQSERVVHLSTATGRGKDTYVQPLFPSPNSSDILLLVKSTVPLKSGYNRKAYLGIDLAPVAGLDILEAQLGFTYVPTGMGFASEVPDASFAVYGLLDESLDDWNEDTLRWKDAPANRPGGTDLDAERVVRLGTFEIPQGSPQMACGIAGQELVDFLRRDRNGLATFILVRQTLGSGRSDLVHGFASKNHPTLPPPTLKLTVRPRAGR
jgi:hypothetical protein